VDATTRPRKGIEIGMSAGRELDYEEVFEDLQFLSTNGVWKEGIPDWAFDYARKLGVQVGHPAVLYEGWKFVAEQAMGKLGWGS
jgi:hypothetical protein